MNNKDKSNTDNKATLNQNIKYNGNVSVYIQQPNGRKKKINSHNIGGLNLFKYLSYCLAGNAGANDSYRPKFIQLWYNNSETPPISDEENYFNGNPISGYIYMNNAKSVDYINELPKTILHFIVPVSEISSNATTINQLVLMSNNGAQHSDEEKIDYSALFFFTSDDESTWSGIDISKLSRNTNIIIEWELSISN